MTIPSDDTLPATACPACGESDGVRIEDRDVVCVVCGVVVDEDLETRSERVTRERRERAARQMTVADLRELLAEFDDDANVGVEACGAWNYAGDVELAEADDHSMVVIKETGLSTAWPEDE